MEIPYNSQMSTSLSPTNKNVFMYLYASVLDGPKIIQYTNDYTQRLRGWMAMKKTRILA